jgi:hypothetical protein
MGTAESATRVLSQWWWVLAVVAACVLAVRFAGRGRSATVSGGHGCLIALAITVLFFVFVIL